MIQICIIPDWIRITNLEFAYFVRRPISFPSSLSRDTFASTSSYPRPSSAPAQRQPAIVAFLSHRATPFLTTSLTTIHGTILAAYAPLSSLASATCLILSRRRSLFIPSRDLADHLISGNRLRLAMDGEELTEQETALYDRQIRVWGADAQRRLSKAHVLVYGMKGTIAEFCKNIVLAGVGSLTLVDDRAANEEALSSNFLIPPDENVYRGKTLADLCCDSLKDFNPMVRVSVEKGDLSDFGVDFFDKFDVVVVSCCSLAAKKLANDKCRKLSKRVSFYTVDCRDSCGEIFVDLKDYRYSNKKLEETIECQLQYPCFADAVSVPWKSLPRKTSKLYFAMRVIEKFEEAEGRSSGEVSISDLPGVLKLKRELCAAQSVIESHVPDSLLERLVANTTEFPPVCAIIGGILGQEVIKAISGKGDPLKNFFFFDAVDGKGVIEDISESNS